MKKIVITLLLILMTIPAVASVNTLTGSMSHGQWLFATQGGPMPLGIQLTYFSYDRLNRSLGVGWQHNYDVYLHENSGGHMVFSDGIKKRFYYLNLGLGNVYNPFYVPSIGEYSSLEKKVDNSWTVTLRNGMIYDFDANRELSAITDRYGNMTTVNRSVSDQTTITDPAGRTATLHFDVVTGRITSIDAPNGTYDFTFDGNGRLFTVVYPEPATGDGRPTWTYLYNTDGLLEFITDPENNVTQYGYDAAGYKCISVIDPEGAADPTGHTVTYAYNTPSSGQTTVTQKDGGLWIYSYNTDTGTLTSKQDPDFNLTSYTYYTTGAEQNLIKTVITSVGVTTRYVLTYDAYDSYGNPVQITCRAVINGVVQSNDKYLTLLYGEYDRLTYVSDSIPSPNITTTLDLDNDGVYERLTVTHPSNNQSVVRYEANGNIHDVKDSDNKTTLYDYYPDGVLQRVTSPSGVKLEFSNHNSLGQPQTVKLIGIDATEQVTSISYDALGRVETTIGNPGGVIEYLTDYNYDLVGNLIGITDAESNSTSFDHNYRGDVTKFTDALLNDTIFEYGGAGCGSCGSGVDKLTSVIDASQVGQTMPFKTEFRYDTIGNLSAETDQLGNTMLYSYYNNGQLHQKVHDINSDGQIDGGDTVLLTFTYLPDGRLDTKSVRDESGIYQLTDFNYDTDGRLWTITSPAINYTYEYYDDGRLKKVADSNNRTIDYDQYDGIGHPDLITYFKGTSDEQAIDPGYNATTGLLETIGSVAGTFTFTPDNFSRRSNLSYPNNITATYSYHPDTGWLTDIDYTDSGTAVLSVGYPQHNKAGNRKQREEDSVVTGYTYDDTYRLTQAKTDPSEENFQWDKVGNRRAGPTVKEVLDSTYVHDNTNRMTQGRKLSYQYDDLGNQTKRIIATGIEWAFYWDGENKLKKAELVKDTVTLRRLTFKYDPFGRRIEKQVTNNPATTPSTTITTYFYDQEDIVFTTVTDGTTTSKTHYVHGPGIDEPLAMVKDGQPFYYHADGLGSVVAITDASGNIVQRYSYEAFGQLTASDPTFDNFYTYTGREYDKEIGLYYYRARYYDAMEGRFISKDPIGLLGGINQYAYVGNNSVNYIDPSGLVRWGKFWESSLGIAGNGLGLVVGAGLVGTPEFTGATKVVGGIVFAKSLTGLTLNWYNFLQSISQDCPDFDAPSSATRLAASTLAPGNEDALLAADAADLTIDLLSGRGAIRPNALNMSIKRSVDPINKTFTNPSLIKTFQGTQSAQIAIQDATMIEERY
jgi:RHS repeat-associated protein